MHGRKQWWNEWHTWKSTKNHRVTITPGDPTRWELRGVRKQLETERKHEGEQMEDFICTYPDCGKVCKSKGGLRIHQVRMHEKQRKTFTCSKCNATFASESSWKNHGKRCMGERAEDPSRARCGTCGKDVSKKLAKTT